MASVLVVRGSTFDITGTVTGSNGAAQDITGATIKCYVKRLASDPDSAILLNKTGAAVVAASGTYRVSFTASDTNSLDYGTYAVEVVVKLASGDFIRNGENVLLITQNVLRTLF